MATYNNTKKTYYTVAHGKFKRREDDGTISEFTGIDGVLTDIVVRNRTINGEEKAFTDFHMVDGNDNFVISCEMFGGISNSILRCLVNVQDFTKKILFEVWQTTKGDKTYTNIAVKQDGTRVPWSEVPDIEHFTIQTGETVKSAKKREDFMRGLIEQVKSKLNGGAVANATSGPAPVAPEPQEDADPGDIPAYEPNEIGEGRLPLGQ